MRLRVTLLILSALFLSQVALAHDGVFFEYAPDAWASKRHGVTSGATPYQLFQPTSDLLLTGFDLWVDNTGNSGSVTFTLTDSNNSTLSTKNITLPSIPSVAGGTKRHIDLPNGQALAAGETYALQITSQLPGFGLYYADRTNFLEHNRLYTTPYSYGAARLGSEEQNFTFKFALYSPVAGIQSDPPEEEEAPAPPETATTISITNAHVANVTANTATIAWTTNIAADSKVTIRSQLNPLYITHTVTDATLELEHTLTVNGLNPSTNYFADVYSSQGEELVLTTYTLSFTTTAGATLPPPTPPPPAPTSTSTPETEEEPDEDEILTTPSGGGETLPPLEVGGGPGGTVELSWSTPSDGEPSNGYRIDIFDENLNLERQFIVPSGTNSREITQLASGEHHAVVYANDDGVYEKVAVPTTFSLQHRGGFLNIILMISVAGGAGVGGYMFYKSRKARAALPGKDAAGTL